MPLTQKVSFKTMLQKGNRVQVPKLVRWQLKMDTEQVLKVSVTAVDVWSDWQIFYARMGRDGRITHSEAPTGTAAGQRKKPCRLRYGCNA